jgi:putative hydrolase of HD superfamily
MIDRERFQQQLDFIRELDKLKTVFRRTYLLDTSRRENDAEHSWQIAAMAVLLSEYADEKEINIFHVLVMLLFHDVVEIEAGDTYIYDEKSSELQREREQAAAAKLFCLLPADQKVQFEALWKEFEEGATREARFAKAIDRFQPLLHNWLTEGKAWLEHDVNASQVRAVNAKIKPGSTFLWQYAEEIISDSVARGFLKK